MLFAASVNIWMRIAPGGRGTQASCGHARWLISPLSLECTSRCRSIPAASACWREITSKARRTWGFPLSAWAVLWAGIFPPTAGQRRLAAGRVPPDRRQPIGDGIRDWEPMAGRWWCRWIREHGSIRAKVWRVSRTLRLLLLDSDVEGNAPEDRELTSRLYGGDGRLRVHQELLLGVGGLRALKAMGITPGRAPPE